MNSQIKPRIEKTVTSLIKDRSKSNNDIVTYLCNTFNLPMYEASDILQKITCKTIYRN